MTVIVLLVFEFGVVDVEIVGLGCMLGSGDVRFSGLEKPQRPESGSSSQADEYRSPG
jgi:hypothetical protein